MWSSSGCRIALSISKAKISDANAIQLRNWLIYSEKHRISSCRDFVHFEKSGNGIAGNHFSLLVKMCPSQKQQHLVLHRLELLPKSWPEHQNSSQEKQVASHQNLKHYSNLTTLLIPRRWWTTNIGSIRTSNWNIRGVVKIHLWHYWSQLLNSLVNNGDLSCLLTNNLSHILQKWFHSWPNSSSHKLCITWWGTKPSTIIATTQTRWHSLLWLFNWYSPWTPCEMKFLDCLNC